MASTKIESRDCYATLGVSRTASLEEIKAGYRELARQYHPDLNPHDEEAETRFKQVNAAYQMLCDRQRHQHQSKQFYWQKIEKPSASRKSSFERNATCNAFIDGLLGQ